MNANVQKILLIVIALILIGAGVWFYFFLNQETQETVTETAQNLFPFGEITNNGQSQRSNSQETIGEENNNSQETQETKPITEPESEGPRLRKISNFPTGGFTPIVRLTQEEVNDIAIDAEGNTTEILRTIEVENQYVRYSSIENGTIFESQVTPSNIIEELLVDNFIPNAEYAYFNDLGNRVAFQYWNPNSNVPETYLGNIEKIEFSIDPCPFNFTPIALGDDTIDVIGIHEFLNRNPQTRIARAGVNSPGNESSLVSESTLTAIKNFQSLYQIDIDGKIGPATKTKMQEVCADQQEKIARTAFDKLERKHTLSGFFLPQNITSISMNPPGNKLFYIQEDAIGVIGVVHDLLTEQKETIFESTFTEWISNWDNPDAIELTTKPSYAAKGFSYNLNPDTERYFKSFKEKNGLTVKPSPNGKYIFRHEAGVNGPKMSIFNTRTKQNRPLSIQTHTDKCVWSDNSKYVYCGIPNALAYGNEYPDIWYQGLEQHTDSLWRINPETLKEEIISDIQGEYNESLDIETIDIDDKSEYLYFIDKTTEELWSYRLVDF